MGNREAVEIPAGGLLTTKEAARALRCSVRTVFRHLESGALQSVKSGRKTLIPRQSVESFLEGEGASLTVGDGGRVRAVSGRELDRLGAWRDSELSYIEARLEDAEPGEGMELRAWRDVLSTEGVARAREILATTPLDFEAWARARFEVYEVEAGGRVKVFEEEADAWEVYREAGREAALTARDVETGEGELLAYSTVIDGNTVRYRREESEKTEAGTLRLGRWEDSVGISWSIELDDGFDELELSRTGAATDRAEAETNHRSAQTVYDALIAYAPRICG